VFNGRAWQAGWKFSKDENGKFKSTYHDKSSKQLQRPAYARGSSQPSQRGGFGFYPVEFAPLSIQAQIGVKGSFAAKLPGVAVYIPKGNYLKLDPLSTDHLMVEIHSNVTFLEPELQFKDPEIYLNIMAGPKFSFALAHSFMAAIPQNLNPTLGMGARADVIRFDFSIFEKRGVNEHCDKIEGGDKKEEKKPEEPKEGGGKNETEKAGGGKEANGPSKVMSTAIPQYQTQDTETTAVTSTPAEQYQVQGTETATITADQPPQTYQTGQCGQPLGLCGQQFGQRDLPYDNATMSPYSSNTLSTNALSRRGDDGGKTDDKMWGVKGVFRTGLYVYAQAFTLVVDTSSIGKLQKPEDATPGLYFRKEMFGFCWHCNANCPTDMANQLSKMITSKIGPLVQKVVDKLVDFGEGMQDDRGEEGEGLERDEGREKELARLMELEKSEYDRGLNEWLGSTYEKDLGRYDRYQWPVSHGEGGGQKGGGRGGYGGGGGGGGGESEGEGRGGVPDLVKDMGTTMKSWAGVR
jgi:hypothetical protein